MSTKSEYAENAVSERRQHLLQRLIYRLRLRLRVRPVLRKLYWQAMGAQIGAGTALTRVAMTWPHQVQIGRDCVLEDDLFFKFDGVWERGPSIIVGDRVFLGRGCEFNIRQRISIGDECLIASGCKFIDHDHGSVLNGLPMRQQAGVEASIVLEEDVWLGVNAVVLKGVRIGRGAIIAAGAVVTRSVPPYAIFAGVPARLLGKRADTAAGEESL